MDTKHTPDLLAALRALLDRYVGMVNSGDCGNWNPEDEPQVQAARAAIAKAEGTELWNIPTMRG